MRDNRVKNRRARRGGAMLELALLIPVYMLIFFIVWTFGDIGQVSSQVHLGSRYNAWKRTPSAVREVQLMVGGGSFRASAVTDTVPNLVGYAHRPNNKGYVPVGSLQFWGQHTAREMFSYNAYDLSQGLVSTGRAAVGSFNPGDDEPDAESSLKKHTSHFVGQQNKKVSNVMPAKVDDPGDFGYSASMLAAAMEGDSSYGENMPWLVRHVSVTGVSMYGVGGIVADSQYNSTHTVLLGRRYYTMIPEYYAVVGNGEPIADFDRDLYYDKVREDDGYVSYLKNTLRSTSALRDEYGNKDLTKGGKLHQIHFVGARNTLSPPF